MDSFDLSMMFLLVPVLTDIFFPANYGLAIIGLGAFTPPPSFSVLLELGFLLQCWPSSPPAFLSEKFPTRIRSTGVGLGFNGGFIIGNWSTVFLLLIVAIGAANFYVYLGIFIIIGELFILASALLSKETKGKDLNF